MIDEKKLIEEIHKLPIQVEVSKAVGHTRPFIDTADILECVENQPKVGEWIPCDERLPVVDKESNATECMLVTDGHLIWMAYYVPNQWVFAECTNANIKIDWTDIIAWMPLPEPYQPTTED